MRVLMIEENTFESMMERFETFTRKVDKLCGRNKEKNLQDWFDNQDVCILLDISKRTLQTYRDNGTVPYTQVSHKMYYKPEDIQKLIPTIAKKEAEKKKRQNFKSE